MAELISSIIALFAAIVPLAIGTDAAGPKVWRLRRSLTGDIAIAGELQDDSVNRAAMLNSMAARAAELSARQLVALDGVTSRGLLVIISVAIACLMVSPWLPGSSNLTFFVVGLVTYLIAFIALALYSTIVAETRQRQRKAILRGNSTGALELHVSLLWVFHRVVHRQTRIAIESLRQRTKSKAIPC